VVRARVTVAARVRTCAAGGSCPLKNVCISSFGCIMVMVMMVRVIVGVPAGVRVSIRARIS
jgi:hypothetical protein